MIKIYEVMAYYNGLPLFFNEHMKRFHRSINKYNQMDLAIIEREVIYKIKSITLRKGFNIKVSYIVEENKFYAELIKSRKPSYSSYNTGVDTDIYRAERKDPLIKVENLELKIKAEDISRDKGFYEILLENHRGEITEGSRSNFLLITRDGRVITSPLDEALHGVTRKKVFEICRESGLEIVEQHVTRSTLNECDAMVLTGTSPEVLPVRSCGTVKFNLNNPVVELLFREFQIKKELDYNITRSYF